MEERACSPSAPALPQELELSSPDSQRAASSSRSSTAAEASPRDFAIAAVRPATEEDEDESLFRDLLRKARGDEALARRWLRDICGTDRPPSADTIPVPRSGSKADMDAAALEAGAPDAFFCPISFKLFRDPVMLATGQTYERRYIERWLAGGAATCPASGTALSAPVSLTPNVALRKSVEVWAEKHARWMLGTDGKIKPIPPGDDFAAPLLRRGGGDADLALAVRLQEDEIRAHTTVAAARRRDRRARRWSCSLLVGLLYALTAAQVAVFVIALWQNGWQLENLRNNPWVGPSEKALHAMGSLSTADVVDNHQYWRLVTSIFLCPGVVELAATLVCLWTFGLHLSATRKLTAAGLAYLYLGGGVVGALVSANLSTAMPAAGAPAAVCALIGAALADVFVGAKAYEHHCAALVVMALALAQFVVAALVPLSSNVFFLAGALLLGVSHVLMDAERLSGLIAGVVVLLCLLGVVALAVAGLVKLDATVGRGCAWCQRVACVPTPWWACESALGQQQPPQQGTGAPMHAPAIAASPGTITIPGLLI